MRFASYNVEWFDALFADDGSLLEDGTWSSRYKITRADQVRALGRVFIDLNADAVMIIEAPDTKKSRDTVRALENFAARFARKTGAVAHLASVRGCRLLCGY